MIAPRSQSREGVKPRSLLPKRRGKLLPTLLVSAAAGLLVLFALRISPRENASARLAFPSAPASLPTPAPRVEPRAVVADFAPAFETEGAAELLVWLRAQLATVASDEEILAALELIAQRRPALALELAQNIGRTDEEKAGWVTQVMQGWAGRDSRGAWQWLAQQPADRLDQFANGSLLRVVCDVAAVRDPHQLLGNVAALLNQNAPSGGIAPLVAVHVALEALGANGNVALARDAVETWARSPSPPEIGAAAYEAGAIQLADTSPEKAGAWLKSLPPSDDRNAALATFAGDWATRDPVAALQWAETLTPPEGRPEALTRTFSDWAERNDAEAGEWLGDFLVRTPANADADRLVANLLNYSTALQNNPGTALSWVAFVTDPADRAKIEERVLLRWGRSDPGAATHYVWATPTIGAERKRALLQKLQTQPASTDSPDS